MEATPSGFRVFSDRAASDLAAYEQVTPGKQQISDGKNSVNHLVKFAWKLLDISADCNFHERSFTMDLNGHYQQFKHADRSLEDVAQWIEVELHYGFAGVFNGENLSI